MNNSGSENSQFKVILTLSLLFLQACRSAPEIADPDYRRPLICSQPERYVGQVVGDGHCVSLIKRCAQAPLTSFWRPGARVKDARPRPGTIIATFENGRYPNRTGHHAAIYISQDAQGIWVWDQWIGTPVHKRLIRFSQGPGSACQQRTGLPDRGAGG